MTERRYSDGNWTKGRYDSFVTSCLRGGFRRWAPKYNALNKAKVGIKTNKLTKRKAMHYKCAVCNKVFPRTGVQVDHIIPIGKVETWDGFIERLFCDSDNLQVLCKSDHKAKTQAERGVSSTGETDIPAVPRKRNSRRVVGGSQAD